jgi:alkylated DNA repair protein (DNA oxidative demethylase)
MHVTGDMLTDLESEARLENLAAGAVILRSFARSDQQQLLRVIEQVAALAPFRNLLTPGGRRMSVAMTNCGELGWTSDHRGYRYCERDPTTQRHWPYMPELFRTLARSAAERAGYHDFRPDACLVNRYQPGTRLTLHIDQDEQDPLAPIVSVSLGVTATFLWGGLSRRDRIRRHALNSGDVVVWGGESRFVYHGIAPLAEADHPLTGACRFNLTFRKAL